MSDALPGQYVRIAVDYYTDDRILAVGPMAEALYLRTIAFCGGRQTDGAITHAQLALVGNGMRVTQHARRLVDAGLFRDTPHGYLVANFQKWQRNSDEVAARRAANAARQARYRAKKAAPP